MTDLLASWNEGHAKRSIEQFITAAATEGDGFVQPPILPDDTMLEHAKVWNARLLNSAPDGFALDAHHTPHITLLQRYVQTDRLDDVGNNGTAQAQLQHWKLT